MLFRTFVSTWWPEQQLSVNLRCTRDVLSNLFYLTSNGREKLSKRSWTPGADGVIIMGLLMKQTKEETISQLAARAHTRAHAPFGCLMLVLYTWRSAAWSASYSLAAGPSLSTHSDIGESHGHKAAFAAALAQLPVRLQWSSASAPSESRGLGYNSIAHHRYFLLHRSQLHSTFYYSPRCLNSELCWYYLPQQNINGHRKTPRLSRCTHFRLNIFRCKPERNVAFLIHRPRQ